MATNWEGPLSLLARSKSAPVQESTFGTRKGLLNLIADKLAEKAKYAAGAFDPESQINQDVSSWHKKYQRGLADQIAGKDTPEAQEAYNTTMGLAGVAPIGMIAWHGSPHKFDKFDLSKIGTGEGAQAYGHGLYLAESPEVAKEYSKMQPAVTPPPNRVWNGIELVPGSPEYHAATLLDRSTLPATKKEVAGWIKEAESWPDIRKNNPSEQAVLAGWQKTLEVLNSVKKKTDFKVGKNENLYKTDIPDEAVARFLDWDKPLSQQAPEVQAALYKSGYTKDADWMTGKQLYRDTEDYLAGGPETEIPSQLVAEQFKTLGIPGIRYLDGGSRSAGKGTSNFVVFDPEMIRILERNEIPTGLKPWEPGEYQFAKGGSVADKMRDILRPRPIVQPGTDTATTGTRGYSDDLANWSFVL